MFAPASAGLLLLSISTTHPLAKIDDTSLYRTHRMVGTAHHSASGGRDSTRSFQKTAHSGGDFCDLSAEEIRLADDGSDIIEVKATEFIGAIRAATQPQDMMSVIEF